MRVHKNNVNIDKGTWEHINVYADFKLHHTISTKVL